MEPPRCPDCNQLGAADGVVEIVDSSGAIIGTEVTFWVCITKDCPRSQMATGRIGRNNARVRDD